MCGLDSLIEPTWDSNDFSIRHEHCFQQLICPTVPNPYMRWDSGTVAYLPFVTAAVLGIFIH